MTQDWLKAIEEREAKASPAPWEWELIQEEGCIDVTTLKGPDVLCRFWRTDGLRDKDFIKNSRNDIPTLLRAYKAAREAMKNIIDNDKTEYMYRGKAALNRDGEKPGAGSRWKTPRELAAEFLSYDPTKEVN